MKFVKLLLLFSLISAIGLALFNVSPSYSKDKKSKKNKKLEWFRNGPQKDWSEKEIKKWYDYANKHLRKPTSLGKRQDAIMNGNKITTQIWNYGSISAPGNHTTDIVWNGLGYGYEFGPFVGAEVPVPKGSHIDAKPKVDSLGNIVTDANGDTVYIAHVISDGLISLGGEVSPDGTMRWGWEPLATNDDGTVQYQDPTQDHIATSDDIDRNKDGKPDSWPSGWYSDALKRYVWPGALRVGATNADKEAFYVMDDRDNKEFEYYPFPNDSSRKGLGLEVEVRTYQWVNPLAEDAIFIIYKISNRSPKDLDKVLFGMWGDPHIGGWRDWSDDLAYFDSTADITYAWDEDGISDIPGIKPGYLGYKFLESPGIDYDGIDNDGDGMIDESQSNGIDDDHDWNPEKDDVGMDGIPDTGDKGEGDGVPTAGDPWNPLEPGEPNFEYTDIDESDMLGLTSFASPPFSSQNRISNDEYIWSNYLVPHHFDKVPAQAGDYVFLYGSGYFRMLAGDIKRFSIALLLGENYDDLMLNAQTVQEIYNSGYQFVKPPEKPHVTAVPGDRKVTLYWDNVAESSYDNITGHDFEGYVIYRSTDHEFSDIQTITDINGSKFLFQPLKTKSGAVAKFDLVDGIKDIAKIPYPKRGVAYYLGDDSGLRHVFVDSNNIINGQTYFYAVCSYDRGSDSLKIPPSECSKIITYDPTTNEYKFDVNTVKVIPRAPVAGYEDAQIEDSDLENGYFRPTHTTGISTGSIKIQIIDPTKVKDNDLFKIFISDTGNIGLHYNILNTKPVRFYFTARYDHPIKLPNKHILADSMQLTNVNGSVTYVRGRDYDIDGKTGQLTIYDPATHSDAQIQSGDTYVVSYTYFPIWESTLFNMEEANPIFDGLHIFVKNVPLGVDKEHTGWNPGGHTTFKYTVRPFNGKDRYMYPADFEIRFASTLVDSSSQPGKGYIKAPFHIWNITENKKTRFVIIENSTTRDSMWSPGERIVLLKGEKGITPTWEVTFEEPTSGDTIPPTDGDVFTIATTRPLTTNDRYEFTTKAARVDTNLAKSQLDRICVVPNPYVETNIIEPQNYISRQQRGFRRLCFAHLPQRCTIRIYTISGELVKVLEHNSSIDDGKEYWNLLTKDNMEIAYGVYLFHVDAPGIGTKTGKFAVIK